MAVSFNSDNLPVVRAEVAGQPVMLVFDTATPNLAVFVSETGACLPEETSCYSQTKAMGKKSMRLCRDNERFWRCSGSEPFTCQDSMPLSDARRLLVDRKQANGIRFNESFLEGVDQVKLSSLGAVSMDGAPIRLVYHFLAANPGATGTGLYKHAGGLFGAAGKELSCRMTTIWSELLALFQTQVVSLDFTAPSASGTSRVVFDSTVAQSSVFPNLLWSEPKQLGDYLDAGRHEFLMYHLQVCNIDLLYNTSSNWLAVLTTGSPCLVLPPFLFDRLMTRIPVTCPFKLGERADGRLCAPNRSSGSKITLPALSWRMNDTHGSKHDVKPHIHLPLERLVINQGGAEQLCISRADDEQFNLADMVTSYIGLGSLVVSALNVAIDLPGRRIGLANKAFAAVESTDSHCTPNVECSSSMQVYYPPSNVCLDPDCSKYMFMTLDDDAKVCIWNPSLRYVLVVILVTLAVLDVLGYKLYKSAMYKARDPHANQRNL